MFIKELKAEKLVDLVRKSPPRSPGLHVSDVLSAINKELFHPEYKDGISKAQAMTGFIWEEMLSWGYRELKAVRPEEIVQDGIICSPDGIRPEEWVLEEYKATRTSSDKCPSNNWYWMAQIKSYMKAFGCGMTECVLQVLYINGNWKPPEPDERVFRVGFTLLEIEENWEMILNYAKSRGWL
jgi:hypothetical protein